MDTNYKKVRVADLRKQLVEVYGYTVKEAKAVKGKKILVELIKSKQPVSAPATRESDAMYLSPNPVVEQEVAVTV